MLFSSTTGGLDGSYSLSDVIRIMADAGYPAIDLSMCERNGYLFAPEGEWEAEIDALKSLADGLGVVFNQAHAPFGGGYDHYTKHLVPLMPRVFAAAGRLGIRTVVVHPLQRGRYYGHERELFDMNMDFYRSLAPFARDAGVKIGIENMWQDHPVTHRICDDVCADPHELAAYFDVLDDSDVFTVCLDIGHVALCGREPEDAVRVIGHDRLGALHVHDVDYVHDNHNLMGMGCVNWPAVCRALADIRYSGDFTLEANRFLTSYEAPFQPLAVRFMSDCARYYSEKIEAMKGE